MQSKIHLIRHGITEGNQKRWFYGHSDLPLLDIGIESLKKLKAKGIYPDLPENTSYYTTGLLRTEETLRTLFGDVDFTTEERLKEMSFGDFECCGYDELKEYEAFEKWAYDVTGDVSLPKGESRNEFSKRVLDGFEHIIEEHNERVKRSCNDENASVVVCHGGVISTVISSLFGNAKSTVWDFMVEPGLGYTITLEGGKPVSYEKIQDAKRLGFGLMRPPLLEDESIDMEQLKKMVDIFIEKGFCYFDTAWGYLNGESEKAAKIAIVDRYERGKFKLATKLPAFLAKNEEEAKAMFYTSLERTGAGYFDNYLLHNLGNERTAAYEKFHIWDFLKEKKAEGKIVNLGFSFHGKPSELEEILEKHADDVDFVQLQINYADWKSPSIESERCYEIVKRYKKPIIIMEPVKGGSLATLPEHIEAILKENDPDASISSWAMRYAGSIDGVEMILSGMSSIEQIEDNIATMDDFKPLSPGELASVKKAAEELDKLVSIPCTSCGYCLKGCPQQIAIPGVFKAVNNLTVFGNEAGAKGNFAWETRNGGIPSKCIECGACEAVCPQHIPIIKQLAKAAEIFE